MGDISIEEWNSLDTEQRVEACFHHYKKILLSMQQTHEAIDMPDYLAVRLVLGVLQNIRGYEDDE